MYIICWFNTTGMQEVVGNLDSTISVASLLEKDRTYFKIGMRGANLSQSACGCAGFEYWLDHDVNFTKDRD